MAKYTTNEEKEDFRIEAIKKWLKLNKQKMALDFGYFERPDMFGGYFVLSIRDSDAYRSLKADNARIKLSEEERKNLIQFYIRVIDDILNDSMLQKHEMLMDSTKNLANEIEFLNPDLKDNNGWKKMCRKWGKIIETLSVSNDDDDYKDGESCDIE